MKRSPLWIGGAAGLAGAIAMMYPASDAMTALGNARTARDELRALATNPPQPAAIVGTGVLRATDSTAARRLVTAQLRADAAAAGMLIESIAPDPALPDAVAGLSVRLSGSEKAVLALVDDLSRRHPARRMARWRIEALGGGDVRLDAVMVTPWRA